MSDAIPAPTAGPASYRVFRCDPQRWTVRRPRDAYLPFGEPGVEPPWRAGVDVVAAIARRWRLRPTAPSAAIPEPTGRLRPRADLWAGIARRRGDQVGVSP